MRPSRHRSICGSMPSTTQVTRSSTFSQIFTFILCTIQVFCLANALQSDVNSVFIDSDLIEHVPGGGVTYKHSRTHPQPRQRRLGDAQNDHRNGDSARDWHTETLSFAAHPQLHVLHLHQLKGLLGVDCSIKSVPALNSQRPPIYSIALTFTGESAPLARGTMLAGVSCIRGTAIAC
jgi:hypothetical protein